MYYIEDINKPELSVLKMIDELFRSKYSKTTFYCHNLVGFYVIFLLKILISYNQVNPLYKYDLSFKFRDNKILSITIWKGVNKLIIKDSYTILNSSLRDLALVYNCENVKGYFPYTFSSSGTLFYKGVTPNKSYFENISQEEYNKLLSNNWSHKDESLKYLSQDFNALYEVLSKTNKNLFLLYHLDMTNVLTVSGLALNLFLSKYYKKDIPQISQKSMYSDIKQGYYGGITEVYKPYGKNLYYYDINSLYPFAALSDMPGLECRKHYLFDDVSVENLFGFFYCDVDATNVRSEYIGLLPVRSTGLIFPLGKLSGWYFSEELKFASYYGYVISIKEGYSFSKSKNVFNTYVKDIYKHKVNAQNATEKFLAKSLLNNLLGRFGIDLEKYETSLIDNETFTKMSLVRDVKGHISVGNMNLVSYNTGLNYDNIEKLNLDISKVLNDDKDREVLAQSASSVVISAAITAYARIIMNKHKITSLSKGLSIYYSDTDSLVLYGKLPSELVHPTELGKFKLEYEIKEGIFISGKTYCLV